MYHQLAFTMALEIRQEDSRYVHMVNYVPQMIMEIYRQVNNVALGNDFPQSQGHEFLTFCFSYSV